MPLSASDLAGRAVAVTGGTGHLGAALVRALLADGHEVRALVRRDRRALDGLPVTPVEGDVLEPASLERLVSGTSTVFHLAGRIALVEDRAVDTMRVNVIGTRHVVDACLASGVGRLVHVSSIHALADPGGGAVVDENSALANDPRLPAYDRSKAAGQGVVSAGVARGLDAVIVQPSACIGPWDFKPSAMGRVLLDLANRRLPALVRSGYHWTDTRDLAGALIAAARRGRRGASYLVAGPWRSVGDIARIVAGATAARPPRITIPLGLARAVAPLAEAWGRATGREPCFTRASVDTLRRHQRIRTARAESELGFRARPLEETIADAVSWFRERGDL